MIGHRQSDKGFVLWPDAIVYPSYVFLFLLKHVEDCPLFEGYGKVLEQTHVQLFLQDAERQRLILSAGAIFTSGWEGPLPFPKRVVDVLLDGSTSLLAPKYACQVGEWRWQLSSKRHCSSCKRGLLAQDLMAELTKLHNSCSPRHPEPLIESVDRADRE